MATKRIVNMTQAQLNNLKGHEFKKGVSGNPKGRPKNRVTKLLNSMLPKSSLRTLREDLSPSEIDTIEKKVLQLELADLQLIAKADQSPAYLKTLAMAIIVDMKNGRTTTCDKLRDRQYGTARQNVDVSGALDFTTMLMETGAMDDIDEEEYED